MSIMDNERLQKLNITLKQLRLLEGLTQKQVAEKMSIRFQSYQAYEAGISLPTLKNLLKLCEIFDVTPNDLLSY